MPAKIRNARTWVSFKHNGQTENDNDLLTPSFLKIWYLHVRIKNRLYCLLKFHLLWKYEVDVISTVKPTYP